MVKKPKRNYPKQDRLGTMKDGLKWKWKWPTWNFNEYQNCWYGGPGCQTVFTEKIIMLGGVEHTVILQCIRWEGPPNYYEAEVRISDNRIYSSHIPFKTDYPSRIDAQRAAEQLVLELKRAL